MLSSIFVVTIVLLGFILIAPSLLLLICGIIIIIEAICKWNTVQIQFKTVYKILPAVLIYNLKTCTMDSSTVSGFCCGFLAVIYSKNENTEEVQKTIVHELVHVRQFYRHFVIFGTLLHIVYPKYKIYAEYEAYKKSDKNIKLETLARYLKDQYDFKNISSVDILVELNKLDKKYNFELDKEQKYVYS